MKRLTEFEKGVMYYIFNKPLPDNATDDERDEEIEILEEIVGDLKDEISELEVEAKKKR